MRARATSSPMAPSPTIVMRRPAERADRAAGFDLVERPLVRRLTPDDERELARERKRDAEDVLGDRPRPDAARAREDDRARDKLRAEHAADADRRALHPPKPGQRRECRSIDRRRERDVRVGQSAAAALRASQASRNVCCGKSRRSASMNDRGSVHAGPSL